MDPGTEGKSKLSTRYYGQEARLTAPTGIHGIPELEKVGFRRFENLLRGPQLYLNCCPGAVRKLQYHIGFKAIAVTVVEDRGIQNTGIGADITHCHIFEDLTKIFGV